MNDELVKQYIKIRDSLTDKLKSLFDVYLSELYDPLAKLTVIKELNNVVSKILSFEYPSFPVKLLPKVKFNLENNFSEFDACVQVYFNESSSLYYLGSIIYNTIDYDLYCRETFDPQVSHEFYARNGHSDGSYERGTREAAAQYMSGIITPLSIAFSMAVDEGFIQ